MLIPDFASEVFGFLERAHVGSSLLANRDLRDVICQLKHRLPVHHLTCNFEEDETLVSAQILNWLCRSPPFLAENHAVPY